MTGMVPAPRRIYLCLNVTDMRKSFDGLAGLVQEMLGEDPFDEAWFVFCNRAGDRLKVLWWDGSGFCLLYKRLEQGNFVLPRLREGKLALTPAQLSLLFEGLDWRRLSVPERVRPTVAA